MKLVERIQFATQQVEKNVIQEVQRTIKQACDQLKDEIMGEMIIGFNRLKGVIENLSKYYLHMNFFNNCIKDMRMTMETILRKSKVTRILRKRMAMKEEKLMKMRKVSNRIDPQREIGPVKVVKKKKRKLKCNEKK